MSETPENQVVAVLGSAGFVGRAAAAELRARGRQVRPVLAPRLRWPIGKPYELDALPASAYPQVVEQLAGTLAGAQLVVNAAGLPDGTAPASPELYGANALLPTLVARACRLAGVQRYLHLSSAAVQGCRGPLDESARTAPFSPYTHSKALGESLLLSEPPAGQVLFRATWVHDAGRPHTHALIRLARSRASCVVGAGTDPTPAGADRRPHQLDRAGAPGNRAGAADRVAAPQWNDHRPPAAVARRPGSPAPATLVGAHRDGRTPGVRAHDELRSLHDVVIVDSPPVTPVADATVLARACDGAIVVVRHAKTRFDQLRSTVYALGGAGVPVLGTVLNQTPPQRGGYYYRYPAKARPDLVPTQTVAAVR